METTEIILKYNRKDFEEIYFRNISLRYDLKEVLYRLIGILIILIGVFIYYFLTGNAFPFLVFLTMALFSQSIILYREVLLTIMLKRQINKYLDDLDKIKENKIIITPTSFSLIQDKTETIEKWTEFKNAEINDTYILLLTNVNYMIPKNSMTSDEFDFFKKVISEKIKNKL